MIVSGMAIFDLILNFTGLLLWLKWRDKGHELSAPRVSLIVTLKKTGPRPTHSWFLAALVILLIVRPVLYWQLGPAAKWTPQIWFGVIPLPFRADYLGRMFLFSFLSFGAALVFFLSLSALAFDSELQKIGNRSVAKPGPPAIGKTGSAPHFRKIVSAVVRHARVLVCAEQATRHARNFARVKILGAFIGTRCRYGAEHLSRVEISNHRIPAAPFGEQLHLLWTGAALDFRRPHSAADSETDFVDSFAFWKN